MSRGKIFVVGLVALFTCTITIQAEVVIETVTVGDPGNTPDDEVMWKDGTTGYGGVAYAYTIGKFEVTAGQYTEFLNAVADEDTYELYSSRMADLGQWGCNIQRSGSPGAYTYSVVADWADRPVNYVSWGDAARFANWLHHGQPAGDQDLTTTEDGSYFLNGAMTNTELLAVTREADATWVIPSEDEWYKAAYHYNDGVTGNYYDYPMSSDSDPSNDLVEPTDPGNNATFHYDGGYTIGSPDWRTEVGAHENSDSPYGTFDQGGNVWEWNEAILYGSCRGLRGGSFSSYGSYLHAAYRSYIKCYPAFEYFNFGFRVADLDGDGDGVHNAIDVCDNTPAGTAVDVEGRPLGDIDEDCDTDLNDYALFQRGFTDPL